MCDILLALPDATAGGKVLFGKNSDRPAKECQVIQYNDGSTQRHNDAVHCSYISLPQAEQVFSTIGFSPYWCWGYETGINEAGVVGGNTAVFTKTAHPETSPGLTGMDLLRLGLERGATAGQVVEQITSLLTRYGQWGSAVQGKPHEQGAYDNAFIIADRTGAWRLETAGRNWVAKKLTTATAALSNQLTIRSEWDRASGDLQSNCPALPQIQEKELPFDFAFSFSNHETYARQVSHIRWMRSRQLLSEHKGRIDAFTMMGFLRDHYEDTFLQGPLFNAFVPDFLTICMHDSPAGFTWGNTATSCIVELSPDGSEPPLIWFCYLPPCSSVYMHLTFQTDLPSELTNAGTAGMTVQPPEQAPPDTFHPGSLWWRMQRIYDCVKIDPANRFGQLRKQFDAVERNIAQRALQTRQDILTDRQAAAGFMTDQVRMLGDSLDELENRWGLT